MQFKTCQNNECPSFYSNAFYSLLSTSGLINKDFNFFMTFLLPAKMPEDMDGIYQSALCRVQKSYHVKSSKRAQPSTTEQIVAD